MDIADFDYELPAALIAQAPPAERVTSRLLYVGPGADPSAEYRFADLPRLLAPGDVLVLNDSRVIPARLLGTKETGGRVEALIERILDERTVLAQLRSSKPLRAGQRLHFGRGVSARLEMREGEFFRLRFDGGAPVRALIERVGHVPLPPYIRRDDTALDRSRYQTVYARRPGAVAAPTAGLHFDAALLERIRSAGVEIAYVTLHVGAGTFKPVRVSDVRRHRMHSERVTVSRATCQRIARSRAAGGRVVAVGTTTVRALETAAAGGAVVPFEGETTLFIYPGYRFRVVDALVTNFHLPRSTLLMMVCAFGGRERVLGAYAEAIARRFRFYSYGDAMFVRRGV